MLTFEYDMLALKDNFIWTYSFLLLKIVKIKQHKIWGKGKLVFKNLYLQVFTDVIILSSLKLLKDESWK